MRCQCLSGRTAIVVAKSGAKERGSEHCLRIHLHGGKPRAATNEPSDPADLATSLS